MPVFVVAAFLTDIVLKIVSRAVPTIVGRFSYMSAIGNFGIVPSTNDVLAFSLPIPNAYIWPIGWIFICGLVWCTWRAPRSVRMAIMAIILGAISNLIDRTVFGGVTDYLSFSDLYPAFNLADLLIIIGTVWWVLMRQAHTSKQ